VNFISVTESPYPAETSAMLVLMNAWLKLPPPVKGSKLAVREADARRELDRIHNEFVSTLTPQQRRLLSAGIQVTLTTQHQEILHEMEPYLEGLTLDQIKRLALYDQQMANQEEFNRGWQAGWESGERSVSFIKLMATAAVTLMILACLFKLL
jgi:hypothetical protein